MSYKPIYYDKNNKFIFLGNGLNRAFQKSDAWTELVKNKVNNVPYPLLLSLDSNITREKLSLKLDNPYISEGLQDIIFKLIDLGVTSFLTTNYSYEIEYSLIEESNRNFKFIKNHTYTLINKKISKGYNCYSYIELSYKGKSIRVFHIHGECARPSSIILKQSDYASSVKKSFEMTGFETAYKLNNFGYEIGGFTYKSWVDFFMLNNIKFFGYGLSFYEFDVWTAIEKRYLSYIKINQLSYISLFDDELTSDQKYVFNQYGIKVLKGNFGNKSSEKYSSAFKNCIELKEFFE